jgi:hypothetical protein
MIREICEQSNMRMRDQIQPLEWIVGMKCDACNGGFLFAATSFDKGVQPLGHPFAQPFLVKFCPFCGARNTFDARKNPSP